MNAAAGAAARRARARRKGRAGRLRVGRWTAAPAGIVVWGAAAWPADAAGPATERAVQGGVGTLPLLAAMGIGVAIAVFAVIAFLQMTTKARKTGEDGETEEESEEEYEFEETPEAMDEYGEERLAHPDWEEETSEPAERPEAADDRADYTIPLRAVADQPSAASPAREGSPSVWGVEGEFTGSGFLVSERWLTMGRDASQCGLIFRSAAGEISRKHCSLRFEQNRRLFLLEDHASSNGTFLSGGERLQPGVIYELPPGGRFALSGSKHWFEVQL